MSDFTEAEIKTALIYKYGWNGAGVFNTSLNVTNSFALFAKGLVRLSAYFLLMVTLFYCQQSTAEIPAERVFELKAIYKREPSYFIQIFSDGKIHYHDFKTDVGEDKDHYAQISQEQLDDLTLYFLALPFELSKKNEYRRPSLPYHELIDFKSQYSRIFIEDPIFYEAMSKKLDALINLRQWLCRPIGQSKRYEKCFETNVPVELNELRKYYQ